jgi:phosphate transport system substrate-binding protein
MSAVMRVAAICAVTFLVTLGAERGSYAADLALRESGSTLLFPVFQRWIAGYEATHPGTTLTANATGSGAGISEAIAGRAQIGASDAYMSDEEMEHNPGIMNIPLAISAQTVNYNVPGLEAPLRLNGVVLADIYSGRITSWDSPEIAQLNPGAKLPHQPIIPIRRAEGSGDTFIFTQFLDFAAQNWDDGPGYGTTVSWPAVAGEKTAAGNAGMVQALGATPYSVGYVGISFGADIEKAKLGTALLGNQAAKFLLPTPTTISDAASELDSRTPPDERLSLAYAPGANSYPLVNYEYVVVSQRQQNAATASAIRQFLLWAIALQGGNAPRYLEPAGFIALPDFIRALSEGQISKIQ